MKLRQCFIIASFFSVMILFLSQQSFGQNQGSLMGTVTDDSGAVLPGVTITATNSETGRLRAAVSNSRGEYEITVLEAGSYQVEGVLAGFSADPSSVNIGSGSETLDLVLGIASLSETVTVTRAGNELSEVPNAVTVVQRETIEVGQRRASLDESLRGIPGVFVQNRRNYGLSGGVGLSIRAPEPRFGLRGVALIQDGIPITTADGTTEPGNVDLGSMGRIDVIRGPSSVLYGNSAGGVINVTTEFNPERRITFTPDVQFGSHGYNRQQVKAEGRAGDTDFIVNVSRFETDGFREQSHAEIAQANIVVRNQLSPSTEIRGVFNFYDAPFAESASFVNESDARNNPQMARGIAVAHNWGEAATQGQGGVTIEHQFSGGQILRATGWGVWRELDAEAVFQVIDLSRKGGGFRTEALGEIQLGSIPLRWTAGADLSSQRDSRNEFGFVAPASAGARMTKGALRVDQQENVLSVGPFVQGVLEVHPRWQVTAGVRYDYYDFSADDRKLDDGDQSGTRKMDAVSPSVGVTFLAANGINIYSSLSTAYETPTTVELSNRPSGEGGFNQTLDPEDLTSFEVGVRGLAEPARLRYEFAFYTANLTNALVPFQRPDEKVYFANAGETSRNGVELLLEWVPDPSLSARVAYTYQDFVFDNFVLDGNDFGGNIEPGSPPHRVFAGVTHRAPFGLTSIAQLRWVDDYTINNQNTVYNWGYKVFDLRFALDSMFGNTDVRPFFGIDNLFGERYNSSTITNAWGGRYYEPSPGREIYVGLSVGFGVQ